MKEWISLNMTPQIGPRKATQLLERFGSAESVFHATRAELESLRLRAESVESILKREFHEKAVEELEKVREMGGDVLVLDDGSYPSLLREIADPPITLYVKGDWQTCFDQPCVGVVGSRKCSTYGENASEMLARDLAANGVCIVSGLARGIDTAAHRGAIRGRGRTVAVLGTGIDTVYPKENWRLVEEILASGGAIVSQFPLGTPPLKDNFPYRNRIISGLSLGILIVEASERSGSLITARLAMEQNREVLAVPGNITSKNSFGTNYLIKSGAKLVQQWQDVATELPAEIAALLLPPKMDETEAAGAAQKPETGEEQTEKRAEKQTEKKAEKQFPKQPELAPANLSETERRIWTLLSPDETVHIDDLLAASGFSFGDLNTALLGLEMKELVRALPGKTYARKI
jgi:DNA processing protein